MSQEYLTALPKGTRLRGTHPGQYELIEVLGVGAFGITYKAHDTVLGGHVAIKEYFPNELAVRRGDGSSVSARTEAERENYQWGLTRFLQEAKTLAKFKHEPNIVRVESFVEDHGTAYIVMDYVDGVSLSDYLTQLETDAKDLSEAQLRQIIIPVLDGLRVVHATGYLHQDIKPANIYIRHDGRPVLLDFGGAREALSEHSRSVSRIFTEGYAPYEQYSGSSKLSAATDLYAVGATLYRCITGRAPEAALQRGEAILDGEKDPLMRLSEVYRGRYSDSMLGVVDDLLLFKASQRPQSVDVVLDKLLEKPKGADKEENEVSQPKQKTADPEKDCVIASEPAFIQTTFIEDKVAWMTFALYWLSWFLPITFSGGLSDKFGYEGAELSIQLALAVFKDEADLESLVSSINAAVNPLFIIGFVLLVLHRRTAVFYLVPCVLMMAWWSHVANFNFLGGYGLWLACGIILMFLSFQNYLKSKTASIPQLLVSAAFVPSYTLVVLYIAYFFTKGASSGGM